MHYFYYNFSIIQLGPIQAIKNDEYARMSAYLSIQMQSNLIVSKSEIDATSDAIFNNCQSNISGTYTVYRPSFGPCWESVRWKQAITVILVLKSGKSTFIDWPQSFSSTHLHFDAKT